MLDTDDHKQSLNGFYLHIRRVFGKIHPIPRQQSAYGDPGVVYTYSGTRIPALAWTPALRGLRDTLETIAGVR